MSRYRLAIAVWFLLGVGASACGAKIVPTPAQPGEVDAHSAIVTKEQGGLRISVQAMEWRFEPSDLEEFFTPFLVLIRNTTEEMVTITYSEFLLLDEHGNQYEVTAPEVVEAALMGRLPRRTLPLSHGLTPFGLTPLSLYGLYGQPFGHPFARVNPVSDATLLALPEGRLLSGAQVRGFLYFRKATTYGRHLTLRISLNQTIQEFEFEIR